MQRQGKQYYVINRYLSTLFRTIGWKIGRHPLYFIFIPLLFTILTALGLIRLKVLKDAEYLYVPTNGRCTKARSYMEKFFTQNPTDFDPMRLITNKGVNFAIASSKNGETMMQEDVFKELQMLDEKILNTKIEWKGRIITYSDICMRTKNACYKNNVLSLKNQIENIRNKKFRIKYPVEVNSSHINVAAINIGGVSTDENSFVTDFRAVRLVYFVDYHNSSKREISYMWENEFVNILSQLSFVHIRVSKLGGNSVDIEMNTITAHIIWQIIVSGIIMTTFASTTCLTTDWITSKPLVGISGCISSSFAVGTAFGLLTLCGMDYTETNIMIPFIVLGIGLDDSFVLLAAWRRTNREDSVAKRMSETYSEATVSITITSLTNVACSLIAFTTPFRILHIMGIYMALSIFIDYVYQVTFFGGFLAMSGYREAKNLHAIFFIPVKLEETPSGFLGFIKYGCYSNNETKMEFYKDKLGKILTFPKVKFIIILLYLLYLAGGIYCTKYIKVSTGIRTPFHQNSYVLEVIRDEEKYFSAYKHRVHIVATSPLDYWNPQVQNNIEKLMVELENSLLMAGSDYTESWLRFYLNFTKNPQFWISLRGYNLSHPEDFVDALRNVFLKMKWANSFEKDIIFSDDGTKILASRFFIQTKVTDDAEKEAEIFINLWNIIDKYKLPIQVFNNRFIFFDSVLEVIPTATQSVAASSCVVILIFLIFIPNPFCAFCVACTIASIEVTTVGYMSIWGVTFHPIGTVMMIMITGFCTDYAAHITCAYAKSKEKDPNQKLRDCLDAAGHAIVQGCLSSLLGVSVLISTSYEVLNDLFKIFFIVMTSSMIQGLFILPVILSLWDNFLLFLCRNNKKRRTVEELPRHPNTQEQLLK